jgi:hypothetical protein
MTQSVDILEQLVGPEWKNVPFPMSQLRNAGGADLIEHKRPGKNKYHVESTGTNNLVIATTIPFRNNIVPGPSEKWSGRKPYPELFRAFLDACEEGTTGPLIHPELGRIYCKARHWDWTYDPNRRDGVDFEVEWIESPLELDKPPTFEPSPVASAIALAEQLDEQLVELQPPPPELLEDPVSFSDLFRSLQAFPDTFTLMSKKIGGVFHRVAAKLDRLEQAMKRFIDTRWWPILDGMEHLRAVTFDLERKFGSNARPIREFLVRVPSTMATLAQLLQQDMDEMIRLNRNYMDKPVVPRGARVKYYLQAT